MHNIANRTEKIEENGKIYTVKYFDIHSVVKYYYQGKLHREKGLPAVFTSIEGKKYNPEFFLFGNKIEKNDAEKLLTQEKLSLF